MTVVCPACGSPTAVYDSRSGRHNWQKRRRRCTACGERFATLEIPAIALRQEVHRIVREIISDAPERAGAEIYRYSEEA